jgi:hypothetical protein
MYGNINNISIPTVLTKTWYIIWTTKTGALNFKVGNDIALHINIRDKESVMFIWRNNKWENGKAIDLPLHNYPRPLEFTVTFDKEFIINIGSNVIKYPNMLSIIDPSTINVQPDFGIIVNEYKKIDFNRLDKTNCVYGRLSTPKASGLDYKYIGDFNSYEECANSRNIGPQTQAITYHGVNSGNWSKQCYSINDNKTRVINQNDITCGVRK